MTKSNFFLKKFQRVSENKHFYIIITLYHVYMFDKKKQYTNIVIKYSKATFYDSIRKIILQKNNKSSFKFNKFKIKIITVTMNVKSIRTWGIFGGSMGVHGVCTLSEMVDLLSKRTIIKVNNFIFVPLPTFFLSLNIRLIFKIFET